LFEFFIHSDVDDGVEHGMRIAEHVDPKVVLVQEVGQLKQNTWCSNVPTALTVTWLSLAKMV
jgi:hypothetical protein